MGELQVPPSACLGTQTTYLHKARQASRKVSRRETRTTEVSLELLRRSHQPSRVHHKARPRPPPSHTPTRGGAFFARGSNAQQLFVGSAELKGSRRGGSRCSSVALLPVQWVFSSLRKQLGSGPVETHQSHEWRWSSGKPPTPGRSGIISESPRSDEQRGALTQGSRWSHEVSPVFVTKAARADRRLLRWYALRRVIRNGRFYLCTSRTRPVVGKRRVSAPYFDGPSVQRRRRSGSPGVVGWLV